MALEELQNGRYRLLRLIGRGAMGEVYLAQDTRIDRQVAIKVIQVETHPYSGDERSLEATRLFQREAQTIAKLNHPHILPLFDFEEASADEKTPTYMVMLFCEEGSFADWLRQHKDRGLLAPQDVAQLIRQAADALQHAHDHGIIHRDVKPANFLIRSNRDNPNCPDLLLADFGVAKLSTGTTKTIRGTPNYMAPEQWNGVPVPATDQYALAIMAYQLLTGRTPFQGNQEQVMYQHFMGQPAAPSTVNPQLPVAVDAVILRALAKQPGERFASIADFARALQQALAGVTYSSSMYVPPPPSFTTVPTTAPAHNVLQETSTALVPGQVNTVPIHRRSSGTSTRRTLLLLGVVLLIIAAGVTGYVVTSVHPKNVGTTGTHSPIATAPTQSTAVATSTSVVSTPVTTSTPVPISSPIPTGVVVLDDPMHDTSRGYQWDQVNLSGGSCGFVNNAYRAAASQLGVISCNPGAKVPLLSNFTFQVRMTILNGDEGGITFRGNSAASQFYYFAVGSSGSYRLDIFDGLNLPNSVLQGSSAAIKQGLNQTNVLTVVANGANISLYVNNSLLAKVTDNTYSQGQIGVAA